MNIIGKMIQESKTLQNNDLIIPINNDEKIHLSMFSWRNTNVIPINGYAGKYISLFGANEIVINSLPKGRTTIYVNSIFGLTEILVSRNIKIVNMAIPIFSGIFGTKEIQNDEEEKPELHIIGKAIFGNITIKRI